MATSQHRCVFVGNIPYDATEEQLIQICEEVGPVVSFRLVIDRETGKPKGYGFCEYKDEETALSARRNLQGYEINGRQLRVDFAENDKNSDRNREQGRGGPGMVANVDHSKQIGGPVNVGDTAISQPIGLQVAMAAASVMAGLLGGAQANREFNQNGVQVQPPLCDSLTLHLAKISRNQLNEVMSELKLLTTQNKEQARQLLLAIPQLPKALFQAQIMLGMVTPQMLQAPNMLQTSGPIGQPLSQDSQHGQQAAIPALPGLPPLVQTKVQLGLMPRVQDAQVSSLHPNSLNQNQYPAVPQLPLQPQVQLPQPVQNSALEQGALPGRPRVSPLPSVQPPSVVGASVRPQTLLGSSSRVVQQMQLPLVQPQGQAGAANLGHKSQPGSTSISGSPDMINKDADRLAQVKNASTWVHRADTISSFPSGSSDKANTVNDTSDPTRHPSKLVKLDDARSTSSAVGVNVSSSVSGSPQVSGVASFGNQFSKAEDTSNSAKQISTVQLPPEVESALLQQVLNLTPEQISSLPQDQQQQVIQLQQMLR